MISPSMENQLDKWEIKWKLGIWEDFGVQVYGVLGV